MEVHARCTIDERSIRAMQGVVMFRGRDPQRYIRRHTALYIVLSVLMLLCAIILRDDRGMLILTLAMITLSLLMIFWLHYAYRLSPQRIYRKMKLADAENRYVFREKTLDISSSGQEGFRAEETYPYSLLHKVVETSAYFFLFIEKNRAYVVDKGELTNSEIETIRTALTATPALPYKACNY